MTINQKVKVTLLGKQYSATILGFGQVNGDKRITVRTAHGVCKVFEREVRVCR